MFPDFKSRIQTFLDWSSRWYQEGSTGQLTQRMFCSLSVMPTQKRKTRMVVGEGSLKHDMGNSLTKVCLKRTWQEVVHHSDQDFQLSERLSR